MAIPRINTFYRFQRGHVRRENITCLSNYPCIILQANGKVICVFGCLSSGLVAHGDFLASKLFHNKTGESIYCVPIFKSQLGFAKECITSSKLARQKKEPKLGYEVVKYFKN